MLAFEFLLMVDLKCNRNKDKAGRNINIENVSTNGLNMIFGTQTNFNEGREFESCLIQFFITSIIDYISTN